MVTPKDNLHRQNEFSRCDGPKSSAPASNGSTGFRPVARGGGYRCSCALQANFCFGTIVTVKAPNPVLEPLLAAAGSVGLFT